MPEPLTYTTTAKAMVFDGTSLGALGIVVWASAHGQSAAWDGELCFTDPDGIVRTLHPGDAVVEHVSPFGPPQLKYRIGIAFRFTHTLLEENK